MFKPTPFEINNDRFFYEPRALWSVGRVSTELQPKTGNHPAGYLQLPNEHFQNPSRWPIRITHAIVSPVGYLFRDVTAEATTQFDQCMAGLGRMKLAIAFPKRSWIEKVNTDVLSFATEATAEPMFDGDAALDHSSGLFGVSRWTFDPSYILPRKASIELILSAIQGYQAINPLVTSSVAFHERGGRMLGHSRTRGRELVPAAVRPVAPDYPIWPASPAPCSPDIFSLTIGAAPNQTQAFPANQKWPSDIYNRQLASRGLPYTEVTGFAVAIDQITMDDSVEAATGLSGRVAPISQRIITKAQTRDAGTTESWWRDGAPLSLVTPTMNPAFVHRFTEPFMLGRGEGLEVSLQAPPPRTFDFEDEPVTIQSVYNVGVSFLGYAVVEDNNKKVYR